MSQSVEYIEYQGRTVYQVAQGEKVLYDANTEVSYLNFTAVGDCTVSMTNYGGNTPFIFYSTDDSLTGKQFSLWDYSAISLADGETVWFFGINPDGFSSSESKYSNFAITGTIQCGGNVMSLLGKHNGTTIPCTHCFYRLFYGSSITTAPSLPATTLMSGCYKHMFYGCSSLESCPELLAETVPAEAYLNMFRACTSLTTTCDFHAKSVGEWGYSSMFAECTGLTSSKEILCESVTGQEAMSWMFSGCTNMVTTTSKLLTNQLYQRYVYQGMYHSCTSLVVAPEICSHNRNNGGDGTATGVTANMFEGCTSLTAPPPYIKYVGGGSACYRMFAGCTSLTTPPVIEYTQLNTRGKKFMQMFDGCTNLTSAPVLPDYPGGQEEYRGMFRNCSKLTTPPTLPTASWVSRQNYTEMFQGCTLLSSAPALPATTLKAYCYDSMFSECSQLTTPPALPATELATNCYYSMFYKCTSLTAAPDLPATELAESCYDYMFYRCMSISAPPVLAAETMAYRSCYSMFYGCSSLTETPVFHFTNTAELCCGSMFYKCDGLTTAHDLPDVTLTKKCYSAMFRECTSLTEAPLLPSSTLVTECYYNMFRSCSALNKITCLATDISATNCTSNWVNGVASSGTFVKSPEMEDWTTGVNGIPSGWTSDVNIPVDLGLSVRWAAFNVGAFSESERGLLFAWGETTGFEDSSTRNFTPAEYAAGSAGSISSDLSSANDAAAVNMGGTWRMPTGEEIRELLNGCSKTFETVGNVAGVRFTSNYNGNSIFMASGAKTNGTMDTNNDNWGYRSSTYSGTSSPRAESIFYNQYSGFYAGSIAGYVGKFVRAVCV